MNRVIKFRGKRSNDGKWIYGYLADEDYINNINEVAMPSEEVDPETVGQFTGLYDLQRNEIYEGDVLVTKCCDKITGYIEVFWGDDQAAFLVEYYNEEKQTTGNVGFLSGCDTSFYNIYGNIHDNPELMEEVTNENNT